MNTKKYFKILLGIPVLTVTVSCALFTKTAEAPDVVAKTADAPNTERSVSSEGKASFLKDMDNILGDTKLGSLLKIKTLVRWIKTDPVQAFNEMRETRPTIIINSGIPSEVKPSKNKFERLIVFSMKDDVLEVLNNPKVFSVQIYGNKMDDSMGPFMLGRDMTNINLIEKPYMRKLMLPSDLALVKTQVQELTLKAIQEGTYVDTLPNGQTEGRLEVVNSVARRVPLELVSKNFGFNSPVDSGIYPATPYHLDSMYRWSRATQDDFFRNLPNSEATHGRAVTAGKEMNAYIRRLLEVKRQKLTSDPASEDTIVARMLKEGSAQLAKNPDEGNDRLIVLTAGLLIGAGETTQSAITKSIFELYRRPEQWAGAVKAAKMNTPEGDKLVAQYVWEALRFRAVNQVLPRYTLQDIVIAKGTARETKVKKGDLIFASTQSAMFDEHASATNLPVKNPYEFRLDRPQDIYFHLGYGHHRCLGDYISLVQVPEVVKNILRLKDVKPAAGDAGRVDALGEGFPERFFLTYDVNNAFTPPKVQVADSRSAFEDYLVNYNREEFAMCLSADAKASYPKETKDMISPNEHGIFMQPHARKALFWCRLNSEARSCLLQESKTRNFKLGKSDRTSLTTHGNALTACERHLTPVEKMFYGYQMLEKPLELSSVPTAQAKRVAGFEFEDHLKFYNRVDYREAMSSPGMHSGIKNNDSRKTEKLMLYARLPKAFRKCVEGENFLKKVGALVRFDTAKKAYPRCKDGIINKDNGQLQGELSPLEKQYFEGLFL